MNYGKRSIALDLRSESDRKTFERLALAADVIVENALPGYWEKIGVDLEGLRVQRPELVVCSLSGFGHTGELSGLPAHGLNMDALSDTLNVVEGPDGRLKVGWVYVSWGNELGATNAALAIVAALHEVRNSGQGASIDISCWDAAVESHRAEFALSYEVGRTIDVRDHPIGEFYSIYQSSDGKPVMIGMLELKFWERFCTGVGRQDLLDLRGSGELVFETDDADRMQRELEAVFASATGEEWQRRFLEWGVPGSVVWHVDDLMKSAHFSDRRMVDYNDQGKPVIGSPIMWTHVDERAGAKLASPPEVDEHRHEILAEWLGE
jgi:crotonobetainyl-CoA:carnitine CoA-transferase CaiB-like acyl-CoA transferase